MGDGRSFLLRFHRSRLIPLFCSRENSLLIEGAPFIFPREDLPASSGMDSQAISMPSWKIFPRASAGNKSYMPH